jgi:ribonuclease HI
MKIYTDGAFEMNLCGWGFAVYDVDKLIHEASGTLGDAYGCRNVTAELHAVIEADRWLRDNHPTKKVTILSDYEGVTEWMRWQLPNANNGWKESDGWEARSAVARNCVRALDPPRAFLSFEWIAGHSGNAGNERAHKLSMNAIYEATKDLRDASRQERVDSGFYSVSDLKNIGLTPKQIRSLGDPDQLLPNPRNSKFAPMKLYRVDNPRIVAITKTP